MPLARTRLVIRFLLVEMMSIWVSPEICPTRIIYRPDACRPGYSVAILQYEYSS